MRRQFIIALLALLPLQFSWAAVAAYCGHESTALTQHFGHHEHEHAGPASTFEPADAADRDGVVAIDFDCGHCHASCCSLPAAAVSTAKLALASHPAAPATGAVRTVAQSPPDRPQWQRFA
jgi:hypothetical protein